MIPVPTLAQLAAEPDRINALAPAVCAAMVIEAGALVARLGARVALCQGVTSTVTAPDRALTIADCAARLRVSVGTARLWFQTAPWSATVLTRSTTRVLVSEARFDALLREGVHAPPHRPALGAGRRAGPRIGRPHPVGPGGGAR